jgi:arabinose-5-phosphate isomerase
MKLVALIFTSLFCTSLIAGVPKGCPSTRACSDDANCKIYAFKHNCHGVCTQRQMKDMAQNFREEDFAQNHPGGSLGQKFIPSLQLAHTLEHLPKIQAHSNLHDCLIEVSSKKLGMTCVTNAKDKLVGVVTDGDIRRCLMRQIDIYQTQTQEIMNPSPKTISQNTLAKDALKMMKDLSITSLIIIDNDNCPIGVLHIHDLLKAGFAH